MEAEMTIASQVSANEVVVHSMTPRIYDGRKNANKAYEMAVGGQGLGLL